MRYLITWKVLNVNRHLPNQPKYAPNSGEQVCTDRSQMESVVANMVRNQNACKIRITELTEERDHLHAENIRLDRRASRLPNHAKRIAELEKKLAASKLEEETSWQAAENHLRNLNAVATKLAAVKAQRSRLAGELQRAAMILRREGYGDTAADFDAALQLNKGTEGKTYKVKQAKLFKLVETK